MVPFYGQGLNCGLEDVRILASILLSSGLDLSVSLEAAADDDDEGLQSVFEEYTRTRHADLVAICELAMQN
jgi:kynurenine 3-monooxygenase